MTVHLFCDYTPRAATFTIMTNLYCSMTGTTTNKWFVIKLVSIAFTVAGCATTAPQYPAQQLQDTHSNNPQSQSCRKALNEFQDTIAEYHRDDAGEQKVKHFPYLRTNRFLATLSRADLRAEQTRQLFTLLQQTGSFAMQKEWRNLPNDQHQQLQRSIDAVFPSKDAEQVIALCGQYLAETELNAPHVGDYVKSQLYVYDNYNTWQRIVGLYYITLFPVLWGINDWHDDTMAVFNTPIAEMPVAGTLQRYAIASKDPALTQKEVQKLLALSRDNPLRIPLPDAAQRRKLIDTFAPVWEIDTTSQDDRIGTPHWTSANANRPDIDTDKPLMYTKLSRSFFNGEILLQINYMVWFPSRPCQSSFDILCGHIDGIIWRVTLSNKGTPLLFDSIHSCGCYHQFFPTPALKVKENESWLQEPVLIPEKLPTISQNRHIVLRIATVSHYINAVTVEPEASKTALNTAVVSHQPYDLLRSLPVNTKQRRSMFDIRGLVPGTERAERFILWPMGVPSPGAMRQWGTHATAFVGRRHFDDPCLIETIFEPGALYRPNDKPLTAQQGNNYSGLCSVQKSQPNAPDGKQ